MVEEGKGKVGRGKALDVGYEVGETMILILIDSQNVHAPLTLVPLRLATACLACLLLLWPHVRFRSRLPLLDQATRSSTCTTRARWPICGTADSRRVDSSILVSTFESILASRSGCETKLLVSQNGRKVATRLTPCYNVSASIQLGRVIK